MVRAHDRCAGRGLAQAGLLPAGALAVHELRYLLAYGSGAGAALQRSGHSYLHSVVPWIVLALGLVIGAFLRSLGRAFSGRRSVSGLTASFTALWLACTAGLVVIYCGQELLEGLFAAGHPTGWVGIFGFGGWWAIPSAVCVGLVLAAALYGADWILGEVARRCAPAPPRRARGCVRAPRPALVFPLRPAPLAGGWSGRGPPRCVSV